MTLRVTVIIPVRDDPLVFRAAESVLKQHAPGAEIEVIVVDNGSRPSFRRSLERLVGRVVLLDEPVQGAGAARNRGLDHAGGDVIFFLDADCYALPGWVAAGLDGLHATGADLLVGEGQPDALTRSQRLVQASGRSRRPSARRPAGKRPSTININTANAVIRRRVAERLRFDTRLIRGQDWAFSLAATSAGFAQATWPPMQVRVTPDERLALKVAKATVAGWCMADLRERTGRSRPSTARRANPRVLRSKAVTIVLAAWMLDGAAQIVTPERLAMPARALVRSARRTGGGLFAAGQPLPSPFSLVRGRFRSPAGHAPRPGDAGSGTLDTVRYD